MLIRRCVRPRMLMVAAVVLGSCTAGITADWKIETIDTGGPGYYTSMKADQAGNLHAAYVSEIPGHPLKYSFWDSAVKKWFTMQVAGNASFSTLVLDGQQHPHISYVDFGTGLGCKVRHAEWNGSWKVTPIDVQPGGAMGYYTSMALDPKNNPILSFYDYADAASNTTLRLRSVFWRDNYWQSVTVDPTRGSGKFNSMAMDSTGRAQIAYANVSYETMSLRYAVWNGSSWKLEIIEGALGPSTVYSVSMVLDKNDIPHIVYTDLAHRLIKYVTRRGMKWETEAVDSYQGAAEGQGYWDRNAIVLDPQGNPFISFFDMKAGFLKVAHRVNGKWLVEVVDRNLSGMTSSLAIAGGSVWVSYASLAEHSFKVAHRPLEETPGPAAAQQPAAVSATKR